MHREAKKHLDLKTETPLTAGVGHISGRWEFLPLRQSCFPYSLGRPAPIKYSWNSSRKKDWYCLQPHKNSSQVRYECNAEYTVEGNTRLACDDGTWNSNPPKCPRDEIFIYSEVIVIILFIKNKLEHSKVKCKEF